MYSRIVENADPMILVSVFDMITFEGVHFGPGLPEPDSIPQGNNT